MGKLGTGGVKEAPCFLVGANICHITNLGGSMAPSHSQGSSRLALGTGISLVLMVLLGCRPVQTRVTAFYEKSMSFQGKSFFIVPAESIKSESLETKSYAEVAAKKLVEKGLVRAANQENADFLIAFSYGIDDGKIESSVVPLYLPGQTYTSTTYGNAMAYNSSGGSATAYGTATTYGTTPGTVVPVPVSNTVYKRTYFAGFYMMVDGKRQLVYEVRAVSVGSSGSFSEVADPVIGSAFSELPFPSGRTKTINKTSR